MGIDRSYSGIFNALTLVGHFIALRFPSERYGCLKCCELFWSSILLCYTMHWWIFV